MKKFMKLFAAFTVAALTLGACEGMEEGDDEVTPASLTLSVSSSSIQADGVSKATFTVKYGDTALTADDVTLYNTTDNTTVAGLEFSTETAGSYTFRAEYVVDGNTLTSNTVTVKATDGDDPDDPEVPGDVEYPDEVDLSTKDESGLTVTPTSTIYTVGKEGVVLVVRYNGEVVPNGYQIYDSSNQVVYDSDDASKANSGFSMMSVTTEDGYTYDLPAYASTTAGTKSFWVSYRTYSTVKNPLKLMGLTFDAPKRPTDSDPSNTSFYHRTLLTDFTGTGCGYCPYMSAALTDVLAESSYGDRAVLTAAHTYNATDPMYITGIDTSMGINGAPNVVADLSVSTIFSNYGYSGNITRIKNAITNSQNTPAKAGIAVNLNADDNLVVAQVAVKAGEAGDYRVGAWLLESGIYAKQSNYGQTGDYDFNTHNHAIRVLDSKASNSDYTGHALGSLSAGEVADYLFTIELDPSWVKENCNVVFFVSVSNSETKTYTVTNCMETESLSGSYEFDYE